MIIQVLIVDVGRDNSSGKISAVKFFFAIFCTFGVFELDKNFDNDFGVFVFGLFLVVNDNSFNFTELAAFFLGSGL
jgi:hypothetical protein